jgi:predicted nucleic acid-binding protein
VLAELASGAWELAAMPRDRLAAATAVVERYSDVPIGIADASNIVLADVYQTRTIATLDHRHFGVLRLGDGSAPIIVP